MRNFQVLDDFNTDAVNLGRRRDMASRGGVTDDSIERVRLIVGPEPSDMDIIRALYQSKNDVMSALNIIYDTPSWIAKPRVAAVAKRNAGSIGPTPAAPSAPATAPGDGATSRMLSTLTSSVRPRSVRQEDVRSEITGSQNQARAQAVVGKSLTVSPSSNPQSQHNSATRGLRNDALGRDAQESNLVRPDLGAAAVPSERPVPNQPQSMNDASLKEDGKLLLEVIDLTREGQGLSSNPPLPAGALYNPTMLPSKRINKLQGQQSKSSRDGPSWYEGLADKTVNHQLYTKSLLQLQSSWQEDLVLLGQASVICLSTCKGQKLNIGDELTFTFPKSGNDTSDPKRSWHRGKAAAAAAEIVRFSTEKSGEIGRLPGEWARPLTPLFTTKKVAISAICTDAPAVLSVLDSVHLELGIFVSRTLLKKYSATSATSITVSAESSTHNPLLSLLQLLKKKPFKKAEFSPEDLYNRKRSLDLDIAKKNDVSEPILPLEKRQKLSSGAPGEENNEGEEISEADLNKIVGTSEGSELMEMDPPSTVVCDLRPYQKQALFWMSKMESGLDIEDAAKTLHPCWEAYYLGDEKSAFYVNIFSGEASSDFPSALQTARGGILADAMGLGKTVMAISLLLSSPCRGGVYSPDSMEALGVYDGRNRETDTACSKDRSPTGGPLAPQKSRSKYVNGKQRGGGTLVVCPMTLLGQWKTELETHVTAGMISILSYYGPDRIKDASSVVDYDVVLTTYGVLTSDFNNQNTNGGILQGVHWYRIILDEAHTIKGLRTQASQAAFKLTADCRWCLTGTPIQNKLEDVFSLLHFLRIEPWGNFGWWNKLIQKPFDEGDERGLRLLQAILKPLMLRRTKETVDKEGRPILVLPPADMQVIECELSEAERDFYEALFKKSKVKFDMFVEQGKVLHNYASILELLLRLRQCCDHPFLVMSRGDTDEFSDLDKLARHFLSGGSKSKYGDGPTRAFVEEVVNDIRKGEKAECPICLEAVEDAVLTPCAHCACRECLFASWPSYAGGSCPICRQYVNRQDLITAPKESRFHLDVEKHWQASAKVKALMEELRNIQSSTGGKSVVFSQWTSFLDLLQIPLQRANIRYVRLDGSLSQQQREHVIKDFSTDPKILVMLTSLKAGGVGINLTAASHAFLLDPWWNPAVEEQAIMRIHRIGQVKNVTVRRFICKETVEQRMLLVQARKQRMIAGALNNQEVRAARLEELKMLFR